VSVLVVSWDRIGGQMAGSAIRALELARALERAGLPVVLAAPEGSESGDGGPSLAPFRPGDSLAGPIRRADVVVVPGRIELLAAVTRPLVVDLYDPFVLSNLDFFGDDFARSGGRALLALRWLEHHLAHGDFFVCASAVQRSFWLGMLAAAGRLNRANYAGDPELARLLAIVPFGVPDQPPEPGPRRIRGVVPGIEEGDEVVLWAGGMWNWVDPLTLIRAIALLRERRPRVKALLLGARHPNPEIGEMEAARAARALAGDLALVGRGVSFLDWVAYDERHLYVLESDVCVSLHRSGVESEFAFRTRLLDAIWCERPMVLSAGDDLANRVEREHLGRTVPPGDPAAVADAIEALLDDPDPEARRLRLRRARESFAWSRVVTPLVEFCRAPRFAPDRDGRAFVAAASRDELPTKEQVLVAEEFVSDARVLSPELDGGRYRPRQRFRARFPNLCQVDVLFWVEPPVGGLKVVFELCAVGEPEPVARVVVAAAQLPRSDWQRFEFAPQPSSQSREYEFGLTLIRADGRTVADQGRICVWRSVPADGVAGAGDDVAFIARYLLDGVVRHLPVSPGAFLFAHNTSVPLAAPTEHAGALSHEVDLPSVGVAADVPQLRAELARVAAQAADAELRARELERALAERVDAAVQAAAEAAREAARAEIAQAHYVAGVVQELFAMALALTRACVRLVKRSVTAALVLLLVLLSVPLALAGAIGLGLCDLLFPGRGRRPSEPAPGAARPSRDGAVSIVIPTWNGRELLDMSLPPLGEALRRHGHPDDEVIVVDNGSEDDTLARLAELADQVPGLRWIALDRNEGFAGATNRGAQEARNPTLVLLNNDMVVEPDFVQPLLDAFAAEPDAFGVSCQIDFIDPEKPRWETGKVHGELRWGTVRLFHLDRFDENLRYPIFFAGGGASAYDRARFLALGGFDEAVFSPVYIEDVDLGYRAWQRGWPSVLAPASRVHHKHRGTTRRRWSEAQIESFFKKNLVALVWKNVRSWRLLVRNLAGIIVLPARVRRERGARTAVATFLGLWKQIPRVLRARAREADVRRELGDEEIFLLSRFRSAYRARFHPEDPTHGDANGRPQVLIIAPYSPAPAVHGGAVRMSNLIREARRHVDVTLVSFIDTPAEAEAESLEVLRDLCRDAILVPRDLYGSGGRLEPAKTRGFHSARLHEIVEDWLDRRHFDVVQVEYTHMAHYLPPACRGMLRVLVEHDVTFVAAARGRALTPGAFRRALLWLDEQKTFRHEVLAVRAADVAITMSEEDRDVLARYTDASRLRVVPNGVACADFPFSPDGAEPATVLFVGFFRHPPNVEAVLWFAQQVLPRLRERAPDVRFLVVGAYPPPALEDLAGKHPGIEIAGRVPDTAPYYRRAAVFVAPILRGSGTRLKILEAMASGSAVVSTTVGAEGIGAPADAIRIADDAESFAAAVAALLSDRAARLRTVVRARAFVEERFDWSVIGRQQLEAWGLAAAAETSKPGARTEEDDAGPPLRGVG
jgi:glycosyltransferase involved in cell wall biosynthesis/GT2 family glycosyltransferase